MLLTVPLGRTGLIPLNPIALGQELIKSIHGINSESHVDPARGFQSLLHNKVQLIEHRSVAIDRIVGSVSPPGVFS